MHANTREICPETIQSDGCQDVKSTSCERRSFPSASLKSVGIVMEILQKDSNSEESTGSSKAKICPYEGLTERVRPRDVLHYQRMKKSRCSAREERFVVCGVHARGLSPGRWTRMLFSLEKTPRPPVAHIKINKNTPSHREAVCSR